MKWFLVILVLIFFGLLVYSEYAGPWAVAEKACKRQIEHSLKFPEEAEWKNLELSNRRNNRVTVSGIVVAPNAFGVRSRMEFDCRLDQIGSEFFVKYANLDGQSASAIDRVRRALGN